ncbi:MAG TPA: hypothetical protein VLW51_09055 [Solirubrobacteraceae bacterium]|jgi:hypothetical protein|nr:hypothetical protein [Solirubrobacteraceae bacterium]
MCGGGQPSIILTMTRPTTASKVLLIADRRAAPSPPAAPLRRYRLARLRVDQRSSSPETRFEYLKRVYD